MIIVPAAPAVEPPPVPEPPPTTHPLLGFGFALLGTDGTLWDLAEGPVFALAGSSGFGAPDADQWWRVTAAFDGSTNLGVRIPARELDLPVQVKPLNETQWLQMDAALWDGLDPTKDAYLIVTKPNAESRYLPVRFVSGGNVELEIDPMLMSESVYPLSFVAGDPYWRGTRVSLAYQLISDQPIFPGPPFNIGATNTVTNSAVDNPGDMPAWPKWTIHGPYNTVTVGVGAGTVTLSTPIPLGSSRIIDMDPRKRTITTNLGGDAWLEASSAKFEAIPPGEDIPLLLAVGGGTVDTSIQLDFDPRNRRAW